MTNRDINNLVAEHVMGYDPKEFIKNDVYFNYSTDISAAWEVMEQLYQLNVGEPTIIRIYGPLTDGYKADVIWEHHDGPILLETVIHKSAPMAICLAALKAMGIYIEEEK